VREPIDAAASALRDALDGLDLRNWSNTDCLWLVEQMGRLEKLACSTRVRASVALRGRGERKADAHAARAAGVSRGRAKTQMDTREKIDKKCPATKAALDNGAISSEQADEIAKTEDDVPGSEADLLSFALANPLGALRDEARKRRLNAQDADELHRKQLAAQQFRSWTNDLGNICGAFELAPEHGIPFINRLNVETDRIFRAATKAGRTDPVERYRAEAFTAMVNGVGKPHATKADVIVVIDLNQYRAGEPGHIVGGGPIPRCVVENMSTDAFLKAVIHDGVNIHTITHFGRHIPAELRTALHLGKPPDFEGMQCTNPDCDCKHGFEIDHTNPVANGGETCYANIQTPCRADHALKTEQDRRDGKLGRFGDRWRGPP